MADHQFTYIDQAGIVYVLNDGMNVTLKVGGMSGFGVLRPEIATERAPYAHGVAIVGAPVTLDRTMSVALNIKDTSLSAWTARMRALQRATNLYKNPAQMGVLKIVTPDGLTRYSDCWCVEAPDAEQEVPTHGVGIFTFWSNSPWFYDPVAAALTLAVSGAGGIIFPITFPITFPLTTIDEHVVVTNAGDVETWPTVRINGPGVNPTVENETTGKTLAFTAGGGITLDAGDYIDIDMDEATIWLYDASAGTFTEIPEIMSAGSEFWPLAVGDNSLHVTMAGAYSGSVVFGYYNLYMAA